jgi:hypothetical protein
MERQSQTPLYSTCFYTGTFSFMIPYPPYLFITFYFVICLPIVTELGLSATRVFYHLCFQAQHYLKCSVICYTVPQYRFTKTSSSSFTYLIIYPLFPPHPLLISTSAVHDLLVFCECAKNLPCFESNNML